MKKFRLILLVAGLVFAFGFAQAQTGKAETIIKQSQTKFKSYKDVKAKFTYSVSNPNLKKPIVKQGELTLKGNKYKVVFQDEEMYCNGKFVWVILKSDLEVVKSTFKEDEGLSPDRIYKIYETGMKSRYDAEEGDNHKVTLFAKNDDGDIWKTELWINKTSKLVKKAVMYARNGSQYQYEMNEIKTDTGVQDLMFNVDEKVYKAQDYIFTDQTEG
jgi:outer membrane lipoprotein carrier protein